MFLIFGSGQRKGGNFEAHDKNGRRYAVFYIANFVSFFFIPLINFSKVYYISADGRQKEISKEEYLEIRERRTIPDTYECKFSSSSAFRQAFDEEYQGEDNGQCANDVCPVCRKKLESEFMYCPHCGQKQPMV